MDVNAGDEHHPDENWDDCPDCRANVRADMDECWHCGRDMVVVRADGFVVPLASQDPDLWAWLDAGLEGER